MDHHIAYMIKNGYDECMDGQQTKEGQDETMFTSLAACKVIIQDQLRKFLTS